MTNDELLAKIEPNPWRCEPNCNHDIKYGAGGSILDPNSKGAGGTMMNMENLNDSR